MRVPVSLAGLALLSTCESCDPVTTVTGCPDLAAGAVEYASKGWFHVWATPSQPGQPGVEWRYIDANGDLSIAEPEELIGYAMSMEHSVEGSDDIVYAIYLVLQYDIENPWTCPMQVAWELDGVTEFPSGYLFVNEGDIRLSVESFAWAEPRGEFDIATEGDPLTVNARLRTEHDAALASEDRDRFDEFVATANDPGPVTAPHSFKGDFVTTVDQPARIYLVFSVGIVGRAGSRACFGTRSCTQPVASLLEAGVFRGFQPGSPDRLGPVYLAAKR